MAEDAVSDERYRVELIERVESPHGLSAKSHELSSLTICSGAQLEPEGELEAAAPGKGSDMVSRRRRG